MKQTKPQQQNSTYVVTALGRMTQAFHAQLGSMTIYNNSTISSLRRTSVAK